MPPITQQNLNQMQTQISKQQKVLSQMKKSGAPPAAYSQVQKAVSQMEGAYKQMQKIYVKQTVQKPKYTPPSPKKTTKSSVPSFKRRAPVGAPVPKKPAISKSKIEKAISQIEKMRKIAPPSVKKQLDKQYAMLQKMKSQIKPPKTVPRGFVGPLRPGVKREVVKKPPIDVKKQIATLERLKRFAPLPVKKQLEKVIVAKKELITQAPKVIAKKALKPTIPPKMKEVKRYIIKSREDKTPIKPSDIQKIMKAKPKETVTISPPPLLGAAPPVKEKPVWEQWGGAVGGAMSRMGEQVVGGFGKLVEGVKEHPETIATLAGPLGLYAQRHILPHDTYKKDILKKGVERADIVRPTEGTQEKIDSLKKLKGFAEKTGNEKAVVALDKGISMLESKKTITSKTNLASAVKSIPEITKEEQLVREYQKGINEGKWKDVREYAEVVYNKGKMFPAGGTFGFLGNIVRGDDLNINNITEGLVESLNRYDSNPQNVKVYNKQEGIEKMFFDRDRTAQNSVRTLENAITSLEGYYPEVDEQGRTLSYSYVDDNGIEVKDVSASAITDWAYGKTEEYKQNIKDIQTDALGTGERSSLYSQGVNAGSEWHPDTKIYEYDPRTHHIDLSTADLIPGAESWATEYTDTSYHVDHLYAGSEHYGTYKKALDTGGPVGAVLTSFTAQDPLGLRSLANIVMGDKQAAEDAKIEAIHAVDSVNRSYNPETGKWTEKGALEKAGGFVQFWWENPATQIGVAIVGGGVAGAGGTAAISSLKAGRLATTFVPKAVQAGMIAGGGAMAIPSARGIVYTWDKDKAKAIAQMGVLGAQAAGGFAGYKWGSHMKFSSPSGKMTWREFGRGMVKQPRTERMAQTRLGGIKEAAGELWRGDAWSKRPGLSASQFGAERGLYKFRHPQVGRLRKGLTAFKKKTRWASLEESRGSGLRYGRKKAIPRTPIESAEQGEALLELRKSAAILKQKGGWGSEAYRARHGYEDLLPKDIDDLAALISRSKKPSVFMKDYMTKFVSGGKRKGELLGSVLSKKGKLRPGDIDYHTVAREYAKIRFAAKKLGMDMPKDIKKGLTSLGVDIQPLERIGTVRTRFGQEKLPSVDRFGVKMQSPSEQWGTYMDIASEVPRMRAIIDTKTGKILGTKDIRPAIQLTKRMWVQSGKPAHLAEAYKGVMKSLRYLEKHPYVLSKAETAYLYPETTMSERWFRFKTGAIEKVMPERYFQKDLSQTMGWLKQQKMAVSAEVPSVPGMHGKLIYTQATVGGKHGAGFQTETPSVKWQQGPIGQIGKASLSVEVPKVGGAGVTPPSPPSQVFMQQQGMILQGQPSLRGSQFEVKLGRGYQYGGTPGGSRPPTYGGGSGVRPSVGAPPSAPSISYAPSTAFITPRIPSEIYRPSSISPMMHPSSLATSIRPSSVSPYLRPSVSPSLASRRSSYSLTPSVSHSPYQSWLSSTPSSPSSPSSSYYSSISSPPSSVSSVPSKSVSSSPPSSTSSSPSSSSSYAGRATAFGLLPFAPLLPPMGMGGGAGGGGRGEPWRAEGYKERVHEVPNIWRAAGTSKFGTWKKPEETASFATPIEGTDEGVEEILKEAKRPPWAGGYSPTKKSTFFTLKK